jgi:hypothetical protein
MRVRTANRFGFAVLLAYLRFLGRVTGNVFQRPARLNDPPYKLSAAHGRILLARGTLLLWLSVRILFYDDLSSICAC